LWQFQRAGVDLARYVPASAIPGEMMQRGFAAFEQSEQQSPVATPIGKR
jgi:hypothetical protein